MTVLTSLLSTFRRSRTDARKSRRRAQSIESSSCEALEQRLLLVNPDAFESLPGAPNTVYLDFDGHTENSAQWDALARDGFTVQTPAFSLDGDGSTFTQQERDFIEEVFERVAEDFRPFNINVTTLLPNPEIFVENRDLLVSVGGNGNWFNQFFENDSTPRFAAITNAWSTVGTQTAFVFQDTHDPLGGADPYNFAADITTAVGISMGLTERTLEGDLLVAPVLGDQIVGSDTVNANPNSQRDIWFEGVTSPTGNFQDDLAVIVANSNIEYRADDHGNDAVAATGVPIVAGNEFFRGIIETNNDVDVFTFTTAATSVNINIDVLDLRARFNAVTEGANLDPVLTLRDEFGNILGTSDTPGDDLTGNISASVPDGTYFIEVGNGGEYGNLGEYSVTVGGVNTLPSFNNPVALNSNPNAPIDLHLAFAGGFIADGEAILANRTVGQGQRGFPAYNTDADPTSFSPTELDEIEEIWARVAEDFAPFNVNVTTQNPGSLVDGQSMRVIIGGNGAVFGGGLTQLAVTDAFSDAAASNVGLAFPLNISAGSAQQAQHVAYNVSSAAGVMLGLGAHPLYDAGGNQIAALDPGTNIVGPILGAPDNSLRDIWVNAPGPIDAGTFQDDIAVITSAANRVLVRTDDHGNDQTVASRISIGAGDDFATGVIESINDVDVFEFSTLAAMATISVQGLDLTTQFPGVPNPGSNLDPVLELLDGTGAVLASHDASGSGTANDLTATVTADLPAGTYFVRISNRGEYGNLGQYTVTIEGVDGDPVTIAITPSTFAENSGVQVGAGVVSRPEGQLFGVATQVFLTSADTSEIIVPDSVTIPANAASVSFDVTIVDDNLLDGDQLVPVRTTVNGVVNSAVFVTVTDHETVTVDLDPNPVPEDAGTASVTIRRSNIDTDAPNHWVVVGNELQEFSPEGVLIQSVIIPWPTGSRPAGENARDLVVLENGQVAVYNGSTNAALSIFNPITVEWSHVGPIPGLSGSATDGSVGGIASIGDHVFLTDFETFPGDSHGMVRINVVTGEVDRFGEGTLGSRLFAMSGVNQPTIYELSTLDGSLLNTLTLPNVPGFNASFSPLAIAFDGTALWVLVNNGRLNFRDLIKIDPNTGALLEEHSLIGLQNFQGGFFNSFGLTGIAAVDGLLYISANNGFTTTRGIEIEAYDPVTRRTVGGIIAPGNPNDSSQDFGRFIGAVPNSDRLLVTDEVSGLLGFGNTSIREIDINTGTVVNSIARGTAIGMIRGLTGVSDVVFGTTTFEDLIYISRTTSTIDVFDESGNAIDTDPSTPLIDPITTPVNVSGDLAGADVPGVSFADLIFRDVTIGLDGLLYGLLDGGTEISVHDPDSLVRLQSITLDSMVTTIAVGDTSGIYGGTIGGQIIQFDLNGVTQSSLSTPLGRISDLEVNIGQEVLASDVGGGVILTTQNAVAFSDPSQITALENVGTTAFVSFGRHPTQSTGNLAVNLTSSDISELIVPTTVVIPRGEMEITIDVTIVDDNERDGDQVVELTATANEYVPDGQTIIVTDVENVGVEVIPDDVPEGSGTIPGIVRIFRTDVDGPLDAVATITGESTTAVPIADNAITISQITMEDQISQITDVNVTLNIEHDAIPDLDVFLVSPEGTRVELFSDLSSNESELTNTTFDDQASVRIIDGSAPYTGLFIPEQFLANFIGENPSGAWSLEVIDDSVTDAGVLLDWSLEISTIGLSELTVTLSSSDSGEADVPVTVTIPQNQFEIFIPLNVFDDNELDGTQPVIISVDRVQDTAAANVTGFMFIGDTVNITDAENLLLTLSDTTASEGAGAGAITGTITRGTTVGPLTINLSSSDTSELLVPSSISIPDGVASISFDIDTVDDNNFDGDQIVTITGLAPGYLPLISQDITVQDQEPRLQLSTLTPVVAEDAGTVTFTVTRRDAIDLSVAQRVSLTSSDTTELIVPNTVIIPPGELSTSFLATVVEDTDLDGTQPVTVTATDFDVASPGVDATSFDLAVEDAEFVSVTVPPGQETILENAGDAAVTVTVSISSLGHTSPIIVSLANSDQTELSIPTSVVIPVDSSSTTFQLNVLDDPKIDRDQLVTITGSVDGYRDGILDVTVEDHEPPVLTGPTFNTVDPTPVFAWAAVDGATRYDLWVNDVSRNINQLFRLENLTASAPLFRETFEAEGGFDEAGWVVNNAEIDDLAIDEQGSFSAHLNGNPTGGDQLTSRDINLAGEIGVQLTYSYQRTGTLDSPGPGEDLVLQYRNSDGDWIELERQLGVEPDMTAFLTSVVTLPEAAIHESFAFRFISFGDPTVEDAGDTVDDWFVDEITIAGFEQFEPIQELGVGHYRFWVRAYDDLEQPGFWSSNRNFFVRTAPVFTSPVETITIAETTFPQISWTSVVDTDRYDLWVNNVTTGESQVVRETNLQTTSFASATAGLPGGTYRAWARAIAPDLNTEDLIEPIAGQWSSPIVFTVLSTPQNIAPSGATFDRTPEFTWDAVEGATNYDIWVTQRRGPGDNPIVLRDQFVAGTSRTPETDLDSGNYVVWVRAVAEDGSRSQWSDPVTFSIGGRPEVTSPLEGAATASTPIITWTGIEQTDVYQIWINNSAGERVVFEVDVQATSFAVQQALPADSYRVWVRAISEMGEQSFWSNPVSFTVVATDTENTPQSTSPPAVDHMLARFDTLNEVAPSSTNTVQVIAVTPQKELIKETEPVVAAVGHATAMPAVADKSETEVEEAVDSIMAEWDGADWWNERQTTPPNDDASLAAAAVGLIAAGATVRTTNRNRKRIK